MTKEKVEEQKSLSYRSPTADDGKEIWKLIRKTGVLDLNSSYSYLLWSKYFDETSVVVESNQEIVGFMSGFIPPKSQDTLFVWQVAVDRSERGRGLASRMLHAVLRNNKNRNIQYLEATVTPSNEPSKALFFKLARDLETDCTVSECFTENHFPEGEHEEELLFKIGPFHER